MDTLIGLLDGVRARGALITRTVMPEGWSLRYTSGAQLSLVTMLHGQAWLVPTSDDPVAIGPGDIAVIRGPDPYTVTDDPSASPQRVITSADYCAQTARARLHGGVDLGPRTCGVTETGSALLLSGVYEGPAGISERLLDALPRLLMMQEAALDQPMLDIVARETALDKRGQQAVLDRLLDLLLVSTLRAWIDHPQNDRAAWYRTTSDSIVALALRLLNENPAHPWTVAELAAKTGVSRAILARRFATEVGEPPMRYLIGRRIALAADLLRETEATVGSIARKVGYANAFALSVAFKRRRGITPTEHRTSIALHTHTAGSDGPQQATDAPR
ncbi:AraC family transcriptional regulator [Micromonospora sp. KC721]|uniref:AraC family transcriptional regulator n=1 Tax=Micromonospora sp. KC721 TaxID=2530380 RepID=UPI00105102FC|nr:AraC family transcriptional regulator [Micromonospora sp. KC721]TDB79829.1 AraC family transcriptional regulator [Micromonospora sp. KC721]